MVAAKFLFLIALPCCAILQAIKCYSKSRLLKKRDISRRGSATYVVTALDKVQAEIVIMQRVNLHPNVVTLHSVMTESSGDDLFLGTFV